MKKMIGLLALVATAGLAQAGQVTVTGALNTGASGNFAVLSSANLADTWNFSASSGGVSVTGLIQAVNTFNTNTNEHTLSLILTNMRFTSTVQGTRTITVNITQDYSFNNAVAIANASHVLNGFADFTAAGQSISISKASTHESSNLTTLNVSRAWDGVPGPNSPPGVDRDPFFIGDGAPRVAIPVTGVYTINTTYTFTINNSGNSPVTIELPDSGVDNVTVLLVPLPPAAWAGMGGLALVGMGAAIRRRRLAQA